MTHDKIRAAARQRMAQTGEPYATARREVIKDYQAAKAAGGSATAGWFAIDYSDIWARPLGGWTPCCAAARTTAVWR
jgi:hypothetical protein